jgi:hypothetical protein
VLEETQDTEEIIGRVAALDIGKAELVCCVGTVALSRNGAGEAQQSGGSPSRRGARKGSNHSTMPMICHL